MAYKTFIFLFRLSEKKKLSVLGQGEKKLHENLSIYNKTLLLGNSSGLNDHYDNDGVVPVFIIAQGIQSSSLRSDLSIAPISYLDHFLISSPAAAFLDLVFNIYMKPLNDLKIWSVLLADASDAHNFCFLLSPDDIFYLYNHS